MKIGIITFHRADNYGALLQAYALQETLRKKGHDTSVIDYRCTPLEKDYIWLYKPFPKPTIHIRTWLKEFIRRLPCLSELHKKRDKCEQFRSQYLRMTNSVSTDEEKKAIEEEFDLIITGSDQIWNWFLTHGADKWYAYERMLPSGKTTVASYGASTGNMERFNAHFEEYKAALLEYDLISTREDTTREYLEKKIEREVFKVLDPTLLMDFRFWQSLIINNPIINQPYILLYGVVFNQTACDVAIRLSKETGKPLVHFEQELINKENTIYAQGSGPVELINYIAKADYIVTTSFHGTVFSIMLRKQFINVPISANDSRIKTILDSLELKTRMMTKDEENVLERMKEAIDYEKVDQLLIKLQQASLYYIDMCLERAKEKNGC